MGLRRGLLFSCAFSTMAILFLTTTPALGVDDIYKWKLVGTLDTAGQVKTGDDVSYTYKLTNTGIQSKQVNSPLLILPPTQFRYIESETTGSFLCNEIQNFSEELENPGILAGRLAVYCAPSGTEQGADLVLAPGQTYTFRILGQAISSYTINSKSYSYNAYSISEQEAQALQNGVNIFESSPNEAVGTANYIYGDYQAQLQNQNNTTQPKSSPPQSRVLGNTQDLNRGISGGPDTGSASSSQATGEVSDNRITGAEKTKPSKTRNPNLKENKPNKDLTWADLISQNHILFSIACTTVVIVALTSTIIYRRIRSKRRSQIEYQKTIAKLRNSKYNVQIEKGKSIKRTKLVADPVELKPTGAPWRD